MTPWGVSGAHRGRLTDALGHFRESLALRIAQDGETGRASVFPLLQIAMTLRMQENLEEAEAMTRRAAGDPRILRHHFG